MVYCKAQKNSTECYNCFKSNIGKTSFLHRLWILWLHIRRNKNVKWGMTFQASCKWIPWEKQKQSFIVFSKTLPLNFRLKNHNSLPGYYSLQQFIIQYFFIVLHYLVILNCNHVSKGDLKLTWKKFWKWSLCRGNITIVPSIFKYKPLFLSTESFTIW